MASESAPASARLGFWHPAHLLATWFGVGLLPYAPGTFGSLAALPFAWLLRHYLGITALAAAIVVVIVLGLWAAHRYGRATGSHDAGAVVIDEVAGQWLTVLFVPPDVALYAIAFALFRFVDVIKPWPIIWVDRHVKGGFGVMFDDVLAGILAAIVLWNVWMWTGL